VTEVIDLPLRAPTDAEVRAGGNVERARGAEPRLLLLHRGQRQPQRAVTAQLRRAGGGEGGKGGRARAREGVGGAARLGRIGSAAARKASDGQGGGECEEGGVAARLAHGSDGGERQWI